ncbi:hypothetical protein B0H13DRAFT_1942080, partial [Mycena leptocephala]
MVWPKSLRPQPAVSEKQSAPTKSPRHIRRPLKLGDLDSKLLAKRNLPVIGDGVSFPSPVVSIARRTSNTFNVVRQGLVGVKGNGAFASLFWQNKWLILTDMTLTLYKSENSPQRSVIRLDHIVMITRTEVKPYCLLLETMGQKSYFLALKNNQELCGWQEDIHSRVPVPLNSIFGSPLRTLGGIYSGSPLVSWPSDCVHIVHAEFNPAKNAYMGLPDHWCKMLTKSAITPQEDPEAVLDVLEIHTDHQERELDPEMDIGTLAMVRSDSNEDLVGESTFDEQTKVPCR